MGKTRKDFVQGKIKEQFQRPSGVCLDDKVWKAYVPNATAAWSSAVCPGHLLRCPVSPATSPLHPFQSSKTGTQEPVEYHMDGNGAWASAW